MTDLDKLEELAKAATPGPWMIDHNGNPERYEEWYGATVLSAPTPIGEGVCTSLHLAQVDERPADASFIASANPAAVLALIADHRAVLARIAKAEALHRRYGIFELEDSCPDISDEHREEHHRECADEVGEFYCDQMPVGAVCDECRTEDGERVDWPCATVRALTEGHADAAL